MFAFQETSDDYAEKHNSSASQHHECQRENIHNETMLIYRGNRKLVNITNPINVNNNTKTDDIEENAMESGSSQLVTETLTTEKSTSTADGLIQPIATAETYGSANLSYCLIVVLLSVCFFGGIAIGVGICFYFSYIFVPIHIHPRPLNGT